MKSCEQEPELDVSWIVFRVVFTEARIGRLRLELELLRKPSEGCLLFSSFWGTVTCVAEGFPALTL